MKIIHISDLHFGMNNLLIIEKFLIEVEELNPQVIIISGDLTQRASQEQYQLMHQFLKKLPGNVLVVPGNHDIPVNPFARLFRPFKLYKHYISPQLEVRFANDEVNILGVNSATPYKMKDGILNNKTINLIKNHFSGQDERLNILFFHHNLNYFSGMHHPLNNAEEFIDYLKESPIHIVCTGHLHYANIKIIAKNANEQCAILHAGSLSCLRTRDKTNSYYVIDVNQLNCIIDCRLFANQCFSSIHNYEINFKNPI